MEYWAHETADRWTNAVSPAPTCVDHAAVAVEDDAGTGAGQRGREGRQGRGDGAARCRRGARHRCRRTWRRTATGPARRTGPPASPRSRPQSWSPSGSPRARRSGRSSRRRRRLVRGASAALHALDGTDEDAGHLDQATADGPAAVELAVGPQLVGCGRDPLEPRVEHVAGGAPGPLEREERDRLGNGLRAEPERRDDAEVAAAAAPAGPVQILVLIRPAAGAACRPPSRRRRTGAGRT